MRLDFHGEDRVQLAAGPDEVRDVLGEPAELLAMFGDLLDPTSRPHRWVARETHAGPVTIAAALDVTVDVSGDDRVEVRGRPVDGYTPTTLDVDVHVAAGQDGSTTRLASHWSFTIEVSGPQVLASTLHPVIAHSSRRTTRDIRARLQHRFGSA